MNPGVRSRSGLIAIICLSTLLAFAGSMAAAADARRVLRTADVHPEDYPTVQAVVYVGQALREQTGGKVSVQMFHSGVLGDEAPLLELVKQGKLDMSRVSAQILEQSSPLMRVLSLPYLFRDTAHLHAVIDGPIGQEVLGSLTSSGLVGLVFYDAGTRNVYSAKGPIERLEDLHDLSIRVQPTSLAQVVFKSLSAKPVPLPYTQTGRALNNHMVNAAENNLPSYSSAEHFRSAPYYSLTRHCFTPDVLVISRMAWNKLSAKEQVALRKAAAESVSMMRDMWQQREDRVEASLKLAGVKFNEIPKAELSRMVAAVQPVYAQFASSPEQQDLIRRIRATAP